MNYFEEPPVDLFATPEGVEPQVPPVQVNPEHARRTAQLAALTELGASEEAGGIFASMDEKTEVYLNQIEQMGEASVREQISAQRHADRLEALSGVLRENLPNGDPELTQGAIAAYTNLNQLDARAEANYAMEQQAVERIQNLAGAGNVTQARLMLQNLENGNALDVMRDYNTKQLLLESTLNRFQQNQQDQPWFRDLADFALSVVPLYSASRTGNVDVADTVKRWYDSLFSGQRYQAEADALWDMPIAELSEFLSGDFLKNLHENATLLGYTNNTEMVELMSGLVERTPSAFETNAWSGVDIAGFIPWGKAAKLGGSLATTMVRTGARREASELMSRAALDVLQEGGETAAARSGTTVDQLANNLQVSAIAPEGLISRVPIADEAIAGAERGRALLAELPELETRARLNPAETAHALEVVQQRLERQFGNMVKDVKPISTQGIAGSTANQMEVTMGRKSGGGYASEAMANRYGSGTGLSGEAIQDESGQWFFRATVDVSETGFFGPLDVQTSGPLSYILGSRSVGDVGLADAARVAENTKAALQRILEQPFVKIFEALQGHEREALAQVVNAGKRHKTWFSRDQIELLYQRRLNRAPSEREFAAYQAGKDINDMEFHLLNTDAHTQRSVRGYQTGSFDTGLGAVTRENVIVDRELKTVPSGRIYDVSARRHYVGDTALSPAQLGRLRSQGYQIVTLEKPLRMADGTTVKVFLVKGKDILVEPLKKDQISYVAGGHRMYKGKYMVRQTVWGRQADTGKEFLENPNTYIMAETRGEAKFWASRMEAARLARVVDGADLGVIDEILGGHPGLPEAKDFVRMLDDPLEAFQRDTKFDVYYDREMPEEYLRPKQNLDFVDMDETGFNGMLRVQGRMYTGRKGNHLPDYRGDAAPLIDPFETINRSLSHISSLTAFGDYKVQAVERWMKTFRGQLDIRDMPEGISEMRLFMEAPLVKGGNDAMLKVRNEALAQREIIKRTLGWKTANDLRAEQWARHVGEWVSGERVGGLVGDRGKAINWVVEKNPISALRGFAFDLKLGLFNIGQLPLQISTAVAATTMSPKLGMKGWAMIIPMRFMLGGRMLSKEAFEARLDQLVKQGVHDVGGFSSSSEFKDFTRSLVRSGFFDMNGTHVLADYHGAASAMDGFSSGLKRVREAGRFAFLEAERWNRIVAWRIAYDEVVQSGLKKGSPEFAAKLAGRAGDYSMNMTVEARAWWQKGLLSIPTQFWAYNARMLEAVWPRRLGGKVNFTTEQRLRLIAGQSLLFGSAGLPITGAISAMVKGGNPEEVVNGSLELKADASNPFATLDRGLIDQFILSTTGADVKVGARYGTGNWLTETVSNLFGMSAYGEVSAAEILGGATYNIMGKVGSDVLRPVMEYLAAESGDQGRVIRRESLIRLASNVSTLGNAMKAYMVYAYGTYKSGTGTTLVDDLPSEVAFAVALGIQPGEMDEISAMSSFFRNKSEMVKEASKVISNYRVDMLNRPDQRETIMDEVNAFVRLLPEDVRRDALRRASGDVNPSLYASYIERLQAEQLEQERNSGETD